MTSILVPSYRRFILHMFLFFPLLLSSFLPSCVGKIIACNGFLNFDIDVDITLIRVRLLKNGNLKFETECSPLNKLYTLPIYENGNYSIKLENPKNWNFEPHEYNVLINGNDDSCSKEENMNFTFTGYLMNGKIYNYPSLPGPSKVQIQLFKPNNLNLPIMTITTDKNGEYIFPEPILPGIYKISANYPPYNFTNNVVSILLTSEGNLEKMDNKEIVIAGYTIEGKVASLKGYSMESNNEAVQDLKSEEFPISDVTFYIYQRVGPMQLDSRLSLEPGHIKCFNGEPAFNGETLKMDLIKDVFKKEERELNYLGQCTSNVEGHFAFHNLPVADYLIIPHYQNKDVKFEVSPGFANLTVQVMDITAAQQPQLSFEILGFRVKGKIRQSEGGVGLGEVNVTLGQHHIRTDEGGNYAVDGMHTGLYKLQAHKEHYFFAETDVFISPNNPKIKDLTPNKYDVCGLFLDDHRGAGSSSADFKFEDIRVKFVSSGERDEKTKSYEVSLDKDSATFCIPLPPGIYDLQVLVPDNKNFVGVSYVPQSPRIEVNNEPVFGITFTRHFTLINGQILLKSEKCRRDVEMHYKIQLYKANPSSGDMHGAWVKLALIKPNVINTRDVNTSATCQLQFNFEGALPNTPYKLCVVQQYNGFLPSCWTTGTDCREITTPGPLDAGSDSLVVFKESGFKIEFNSPSVVLPLNLVLNKEQPIGPEYESLDLADAIPSCQEVLGNTEGLDGEMKCRLIEPVTTLCLPEYGTYFVKPLSCYIFNSNLPVVENIEDATPQYRLKIEDKATKGSNDGWKVSFKSEKYLLTMGISPLPADVLKSINADLADDTRAKICVYSVNKPKTSLLGCRDFSINHGDVINVDGSKELLNQTLEIDFTQYPKLNVTITSTNYLFERDEILFEYGPNFTCQNAKVIFKMVPSIFVEGSVHPPEPGVKVELVSGESSNIILKTTSTDESGRYIFGPLISDAYETKATKEGYILNQRPDDPFSFDISKISKLQIRVVLEEDSKVVKEGSVEKIGVSNALISISGGPNFRALNVTGSDGSISYYGLSPGQYFIRPIMKEYNFTPASIVVTVESGSSQSIEIYAVKAAFSVRGIVTSMNGLPLGGGKKDPQTPPAPTTPAVVVEARGLAASYGNSNPSGCQLLEEEGTPSGSSGHFEIRALVPGCDYAIRVRSADSHNVTSPSFRSFPSSYHLTVPFDQKIDLTEFLRFRLMPLTPRGVLVFGSVAIFVSRSTGGKHNVALLDSPNFQLLEHFKISLFASSPLLDQTPLQSKALSPRSEFFTLDPIALDFEKYVLKLESGPGLDNKLYDPYVAFKTFSANSGSVFLAFELKLVEKKRVLIEEDSNKSRKEFILFFILIMGLAIMIYGYEKVLYIITSVLQQVIPTLEYILKKSSSLKTSNHSINNSESSSSVESISPSTSLTSFANYLNLKKKIKVKKT